MTGGSAHAFFGIPQKIYTRKNQTQKNNFMKITNPKNKSFVQFVRFVWPDTQKNKFYQNCYPKKISEKSSDPKNKRDFSKPKKIGISKISDSKK